MFEWKLLPWESSVEVASVEAFVEASVEAFMEASAAWNGDGVHTYVCDH